MSKSDSRVRRDCFRRMLLEKNYAYKRQARRMQVYKKGTHRVMIPRTGDLDESQARSIMHQMGMGVEEVEAFIAANKATV